MTFRRWQGTIRHLHYGAWFSLRVDDVSTLAGDDLPAGGTVFGLVCALGFQLSWDNPPSVPPSEKGGYARYGGQLAGDGLSEALPEWIPAAGLVSEIPQKNAFSRAESR